MTNKQLRVLPGFGLTMGYTISYISLLVLIPLAGVFILSASLTWDEFVAVITEKNVLHSFAVSFGCSSIAAFINVFIGFVIAWVLVRYRFWGRKFFDSLIDLPFAMPTAVAGIALSTLYGPNGPFGAPLSKAGIEITNNLTGIVIALLFIGLPFVVRTIQPVLEELEKEHEEAATTLGAGRLAIFFRITLPQLVPSILTGFTLAFARSIGEYGSVIFIAGNIPGQTEIAPLLIMAKLDEYKYAGAASIAAVMLVISFLLLFILNALQWWRQKRMGSKIA